MDWSSDWIEVGYPINIGAGLIQNDGTQLTFSGDPSGVNSFIKNLKFID